MRMLWLSLGLVVLFLSAVSTAPADEEEDRLLGGVNATSGDFEKFNFYVRLGNVIPIPQGSGSSSQLVTVCQGILYDYDTIVTVAHCAKFTQILRQAVCGTVETQTQNISSVTLHPYFGSSNGYGVYLPHDIAVVKLASKFTPSKYCKPAKLPSCYSSNYYGQEVTVFGFNTTGLPLLWFKRNWVTVTMKVMPWLQCYSYYLGAKYNKFMQDCLIDVAGSQTGCLNDHGTAAVTADGTIIGLGSWMLKACQHGYTSVPAVYVRLANYLDWIASFVTPYWE